MTATIELMAINANAMAVKVWHHFANTPLNIKNMARGSESL